jgi:hypothetical protein
VGRWYLGSYTTCVEGQGSDFSRCLLVDNFGTLELDGSSSMSQCTILRHETGAIECLEAPTIELSIIAFNGAAVAGNAVPLLSCCDVFGNSGGDWVGPIAGQDGVNGNFSDWPRFCDPDNDLFTLAADSPCLPENHPHGYSCGGFIGAFDLGCGPASLTPETWARIKARYR